MEWNNTILIMVPLWVVVMVPHQVDPLDLKWLVERSSFIHLIFQDRHITLQGVGLGDVLLLKVDSLTVLVMYPHLLINHTLINMVDHQIMMIGTHILLHEKVMVVPKGDLLMELIKCQVSYIMSPSSLLH